MWKLRHRSPPPPDLLPSSPFAFRFLTSGSAHLSCSLFSLRIFSCLRVSRLYRRRRHCRCFYSYATLELSTAYNLRSTCLNKSFFLDETPENSFSLETLRHARYFFAETSRVFPPFSSLLFHAVSFSLIIFVSSELDRQARFLRLPGYVLCCRFLLVSIDTAEKQHAV